MENKQENTELEVSILESLGTSMDILSSIYTTLNRGISEALIVVRDLTIVWVNTRTVGILKRSLDSILDTPLFDVIPELKSILFGFTSTTFIEDAIEFPLLICNSIYEGCTVRIRIVNSNVKAGYFEFVLIIKDVTDEQNSSMKKIVLDNMQELRTAITELKRSRN